MNDFKGNQLTEQDKVFMDKIWEKIVWIKVYSRWSQKKHIESELKSGYLNLKHNFYEFDQFCVDLAQ